MAAPPPTEADGQPAPLSPVNLWKIYKAVEKLGAYELVRKAPPVLARLHLPGVSLQPWPCLWTEEPGSPVLPLPPHLPRWFSAAQSSFSAFPICSARPVLEKLLGPAVRGPGRENRPLSEPQSSCQTAVLRCLRGRPEPQGPRRQGALAAAPTPGALAGDRAPPLEERVRRAGGQPGQHQRGHVHAPPLREVRRLPCGASANLAGRAGWTLPGAGGVGTILSVAGAQAGWAQPLRELKLWGEEERVFLGAGLLGDMPGSSPGWSCHMCGT